MKDEFLRYYDQNYNPLFLYEQKSVNGGYEIVDILSGLTINSPTFCLKNKSKCCRYCGKNSSAVSFKKKEHVFSESLGNKLFISKYYECDNCNEFFGTAYENDLNSFLHPYLVLNGITGKKGKKKYKSFDKGNTAVVVDDVLKITEQVDSCKVRFNEENQEFEYEFDMQAFSLSNVYKALLKMALAMLSDDEIKHFQITKATLMNQSCLIGYEFIIFNFYPGFNRFDFTTIGWKRKNNDSTIPTYQFAVMNGNFLLQIPIYSDEDIKANKGRKLKISCIPTPTPFDASCIGDVSTRTYKINDTEVTSAKKMIIKMNYDKKEEIN